MGLFSAFLCSVIAAFYFICNDFFKLRGDVFIFWRSLFSAVLLIPSMLVFDWDDGMRFYAYAAIAGVAAGFGDMASFNASRHYSAAAISRVVQFRNVVLFCIWPLIVAGYWERLTASPIAFWGSVILMAIGALAMFRMRRNPVSSDVIKAALPVMVFIGVSDILFSLGVNGVPSFELVLKVAFIFSVAMFLTAAAWLVGQKILGHAADLFAGSWARAGIINGSLFIGVVATKGLALSYLENPGLFGAIISVYSLWLYFLHRYWMKRDDPSDPRLGFVVVLCGIGLGLLSAYMPR